MTKVQQAVISFYILSLKNLKQTLRVSSLIYFSSFFFFMSVFQDFFAASREQQKPYSVITMNP